MNYVEENQAVARILTRPHDSFSSLVVMFRDEQASIVRASIVVTDGPHKQGLGGTRSTTWASDAAMLEDNIRLARGMERKSQFHELPFDGGKVCVQVAHSGDQERAFRRLAEAVESLKGRCVTTEDMGTTPALMSIMHAVSSKYVMGRPENEGGSGDPSPFTAEGVLQSIRVTAEEELKRGMDGLRVHLVGVGHVGGILAEKLLADGVRLSVTETDPYRLSKYARPGVSVVAPGEYTDADVYCPCAGGAVVGPEFPRSYRAIVGAANNQLTSDQEIAASLARKSIVYVPDWAANGGGLCSVAAEYLGESRDWAWSRARFIGERIRELLQRARTEGRTPLDAAFAICDSRRNAALASSS